MSETEDLMHCRAKRFDGKYLCINRDSPCFNTYVNADQCARCQAGEVVAPIKMDPTFKTYTLGPPRPDLVALIATLPPFVEGRDKPMRLELDGSIIYGRTDDWEPPRDIDGYRRDPDDAWHFMPLWPKCIYHSGSTVRYATCGCIGVRMKCNCPECPRFAQFVKCEECLECLQRKES
jgi:hypothetical protein